MAQGKPTIDFILQANEAYKLGRLLGNSKIRDLIERDPNIHFEVRDDDGFFGKFPEGVDQLYFQTGGVIKDITRLKGLFDLFAAVLDHLCYIGSAYEDDPGLEVK